MAIKGLKVILAGAATAAAMSLGGTAALADDNSRDNALIDADSTPKRVSDFTTSVDDPRLVAGSRSHFLYDGDEQLGARVCGNKVVPLAVTQYEKNGITYTRVAAINSQFKTNNIKEALSINDGSVYRAEILENSSANGADYEYKPSVSLSSVWYTNGVVAKSTDVLIIQENIDCDQPSSGGKVTPPPGGGTGGCGCDGGGDNLPVVYNEQQGGYWPVLAKPGMTYQI